MNGLMPMPPRFLLLTACLLALAAPALRAAENPPMNLDAPAAAVDGKIITYSEANAQITEAVRTLSGQYKGAALDAKIIDLQREVISRIAEDELLYAEFKKREFKVPQELQRRRMDAIIRTQSGGSREKFEATLFAQGLSWNDFEEQVRKSVAVDMMIGEFVRRMVRVSPTDIRAYYDAHTAEFSAPARLRLSMILLKPDGKYAGTQEDTVKTIRQQVAQGADFGWLAQNYSDDGNAGKSKGDLGWMNAADVQPSFCEAVKGLAAGAVAEPLTIQGNTVLLKLTAREEARLAPLDAALAQRIEDKLRAGAEAKRLDAYLATLKKKFQFRLYF